MGQILYIAFACFSPGKTKFAKTLPEKTRLKQYKTIYELSNHDLI